MAIIFRFMTTSNLLFNDICFCFILINVRNKCKKAILKGAKCGGEAENAPAVNEKG